MTNRTRYIIWAILGTVFVAAALVIALWRGMNSSPFELAETAYVYVRPETTAEQVWQQIDSLSSRDTRLYWRVAQSVRPYTPRTGRYAVEPGQSFLSVYKNLLRGSQQAVRLTLPSVRTLQRLAGVLSHRLMLDSAETADCFADSTFAARYGYSIATLPALFIPNTYDVYWDTSLDAFMHRMQTENQRFWEQEGRHEAALALGMTHEEVVTLASIVDEETANNAEKPRVAGLYMNRLQRKMLLQADPTVKFAIGDATLRRIRAEHLKTESPYNTYLVEGLPPGPIRIPSIAGIDAVLHMEQHNYIYMCAKADFSGTHAFAASFSEHKQNARAYQRALNARGIR